MGRILSLSLLMAFLAVFVMAGCTQSEEPAKPAEKPAEKADEGEEPAEKPAGGEKVELVVFHAGSLSKPLEEIEKMYEEKYPNVDILREASGSRVAAKKISELGRACDIIAVADYTVIQSLLIPEHCDWLARFATNAMTLTFTPESKFADEITKDNWFEILQRDGVEWGHSNPDADPCGYRSVLVMKLAELHYGQEGLFDKLISARKDKNIREKSVELISLLKSGELDYAFEYLSVAVQYGLEYIEFAPEIDLQEFDQAESYARAEMTLEDGTVKKGAPIIYGISVPEEAPNKDVAVDFTKFIMTEGKAVFKKMGQPPLEPPVGEKVENIPEEIKEILAK